MTAPSTPSLPDVAEQQRQAHRARYEALRAAGQGATVAALPPPSPRGMPLPAEAVRHVETVPGGWAWTTRLRRGDGLRIANPDGRAAASLLAWCCDDTSERLNLADTVKVQWSTVLRRGRVLYTDMGRVALSIIEDSCGAHDTLVGPSTAAWAERVFGRGAARNGRDNFVAAAAKLGLGRRDLPPCITFFAPVRVDADGRLGWRDGVRQPGDVVDLRAEMDLWVIVSNTAHPLDPQPLAEPPAIALSLFDAPPAGPDDPCRQAGDEVRRAFEFTERHVRARPAGARP